MSSVLKAVLRRIAAQAPWGARYALLDGCLDGTRLSDIAAHVLPRLRFSEVAADGDRGTIASSSADNMVIVEYAQTGTFAPGVTEALQAFFAPTGGTYLDIGANIGLMTVPFARDPRIRCLAFEPDPTNFGFLQRNIARNAPASSAELHQVALFKERTTLSLALADGNLGDHRVTLSGVPGRRNVDVRGVPLDDFSDRVERPLAVKIDTQGAEPFIIAGGQNVLAEAGLLAMEFCPYLMRQLGGDLEAPIALISSFSSVAVMRGGKAETPRYVAPQEAVRMMHDKLCAAADTDQDYLDILARR
jgi:FkbM family methyltransferase